MLLLLVILVLLHWPTSLIAFVVDRLFIHQKTSLIVLSVLLLRFLKFQTISEIFQPLYFQFFGCTRSKLQSTMPLQFLQKLRLVNFVSMKTSLVVFKNTFNLTWFRLFHIFFSEDMKWQCLLFMGKAFSYHTIIESIQSFLFKQTSKCRAGASWSKENKSPTEANIGKHSFNGCKKTCGCTANRLLPTLYYQEKQTVIQ